MISRLKDKKVLFIATKNLDYLRNTQEINIIKKYAKSYDIIGSYEKKYLLRLWEVYSELLLKNVEKYDVIFVGFAPQLVIPLWGWKFRKKFVIEDFFISFYDTLCFDRKKFRPEGIIARLIKWIDCLVINAADIIICDTNAHGKYFAKEFSCNKEKIYTLYLEADRTIYYPVQTEKPEHLKGKYVVLYFGSILPLQGVDIVLKAYEILKEEKDIYFYCIGPIQDDELTFDKPISENIEYISWLSQEELARYIGYADLCLAGHFNSQIEKAKRTIPGKTYIYQAMDKAMILGENLANHELFSESEEISFVEMGNAEALAEEIFRFSKEKGEKHE